MLDKFQSPGLPAPSPELTPDRARSLEMLKLAHATCAGQDAGWDAWAGAFLKRGGAPPLGTVAMPVAADAYLRGLQAGLKAHVPVEAERIAETKVEFEVLSLKALVRMEIAVAMGALIVNNADKGRKAMDECQRGLVRLGVPVIV